THVLGVVPEGTETKHQGFVRGAHVQETTERLHGVAGFEVGVTEGIQYILKAARKVGAELDVRVEHELRSEAEAVLGLAQLEGAVLGRRFTVLPTSLQLEPADVEDRRGTNIPLIRRVGKLAVTGPQMTKQFCAQVLGGIEGGRVSTEREVLAMPEVGQTITVGRRRG